MSSCDTYKGLFYCAQRPYEAVSEAAVPEVPALEIGEMEEGAPVEMPDQEVPQAKDYKRQETKYFDVGERTSPLPACCRGSTGNGVMLHVGILPSSMVSRILMAWRSDK